MDDRSVFPTVTTQFALACCFATLTYMVTLNEGIHGMYYPLVLLAYAPLNFWINRKFLQKERTLRGVTVLNSLMWAVLFATVCWRQWSSGLAYLGITGGICLWLTVRGAHAAMKGINLRTLLLTLDASALLLVLFTGYLAAMQASYLWCAPMAAGFAACVLGMTANRMGRPMGGREWVLVGGAFLLISLLVLLLVGVAAAPAGQGLVILWTWLVGAAKFVVDLLWRILLFLTSLFPAPEYGEVEMEPPAITIPGTEEEMAEGNPAALVVLVVLAVVLAVGAGIWLLRQLGKLRVGGQAEGRKRAQIRKRSRPSLWKALKRLLSSWVRRVRLRRFLRRHRDQPVGLYYILVRRCSLGPWHKKPGETPREFLIRLQGCAQGDPELEEALGGLAPLVDMALYAPRPKRARVPQAALIRKRIRRAVSRQFVRDCVARAQNMAQRAKEQKPLQRGVDKGEKLC